MSFFRPCSLQSAFSTGSSSAAPAPQHNVGSTGSATLHICALTINIAEPGPEEHPDPDTFIDVSWSSVALSYFKSCSVELQSCGTESYLEVWIRNSNFFPVSKHDSIKIF